MSTIYEIDAGGGLLVEIEGDREPTKAEALKAIDLARGAAPAELPTEQSKGSLGDKALAVGGDIAAEAGGATAGQIVGTALLPGAGTAIGGAIGGGIGNIVAQVRQMARGERESFSFGQLGGAAAVSAVPGSGLVKAAKGTGAAAVAGNVARAGAEAAAAGAKTVETLIDERRLPTLGEVGWSAGGGLLFGAGIASAGKLGKGLANVLHGKTAQEAKPIIDRAVAAAKDEGNRTKLRELQSFVDEKLGIGGETKSAEDAAKVLSAEHPPVVNSAKASAEAMAAGLDENATRANDFTKARVEDAGDTIRANQLAGDETTVLGDNTVKNQQTVLDVKLGASEGARRERARLDAIMDETRTEVDDGSLPLGVQLSTQAQRIYDEHGFISPRLAASLAGGSVGTIYGFSQGDTPEERAANALKYGVLGFGVGFAGGTMLRAGAPSPASRKSKYVAYLESLAKGTDGMPKWYQRFRTIEPIVKLRESMLNARTRVKDAVAATPGNVAEDANPWLAGKLFPGRVAARVKIDAERATQAAVWNRDKAADVWAKSTGGTTDDFNARLDEFMIAKTAPDYNREHADFTAKTGKPAAGMSNTEATQVLTKAKGDGLDSIFEDLRAQIRAIDETVLYTLEDAQLVSPSQAAALRKKYPEHVPLNRVLPDADDASAVGAVFGVPRFNLRGSGVKEGAGSDLVVDDIYSSVLTNLKEAIIRGERNKVSLSAVKFFETHPMPGVRVKRPKPIGTASDGTPILPQPDTNATLVAREVTDSARPAHQVWVEFDDPLLGQAFNGMNVEQTNTLLRWLSVPTRLLAGFYTRFNAGFIPTNKIRDLQEAVVTVATSADWKAAAQIPAKSFRDMKAVSDWLRGKSTPAAAIYEDVMLHGGFTGGLATSTRDSAEKTIAKVGRRTPIEKAKDATLGFFDFLNEVAEDSTRLSAARAAKDAGASDNLAALGGREAGVDFNMKGTLTNQVSSLYAFVNPGVQGVVRAGKAVVRNPGTIGAAAAGFMGAGLAVDAWNKSIDPDWKKKKVFAAYRANSIPLIVSSDAGGYYVFTLPVAQMLRPVKALVDLGLDLAAGDVRDPKDAASRVANGVAESLNPLGGQNVRQAVTPTLADPLVDVLANESFTGAKIHPQGGPGDADITKIWPDTLNTEGGAAALSAARILERIGVDVSPESLLYMSRSYAGGPGELAKQSATVANAAAYPGSHLVPRDIPVVSRFVRYVRKDAGEAAASERRIVAEERTKSSLAALELRAKAQDWIQRGKVADDAGKRALLVELAGDARLRAAVGKEAQRESVKLDAVEREIANAHVHDGTRARIVVRLLRELPEDQREPALQRLRDQGIVSREVLKQIGVMQDGGDQNQ